jgi:hypothetical protein
MKFPIINRRRLVAGAAIVLAGGAALAGPVAAQVDDSDVRTTWAAEALQPLVEDGTLTQAQADAVEQALADARPVGHERGAGRRLDVAATAIGIGTDELGEALRNGSTIADVAAINGVGLQVVVDAMVAEAQEHLDEHVAAGDLTTDEAAARLATITERITAFVNGNLPAGGLGSGPGRGRGHGPHDDLDGDISETDATGTTDGTTGS